MSVGATVAIVVVGSVFVLRKPLARILALLFVRHVVRRALADVGKSALAKTIDRVTLVPDPGYSWKDATAESRYAGPLGDLGFVPAGAFSVTEMPGVHVQMLVHEEDSIHANVYEHPQAGCWLELVCRYASGRMHTVTDLPSRGIDSPPWLKTLRVDPGTPVATMVQGLLKDRRPTGLDPATPADAKRQFEIAYAQFMAWKKKTGISPAEVARQIPRFVESKPDEVEETSSLRH